MTDISSRLRDRIFGLTGLLLLCAASCPASAQQVDYNKAERFLTWHTERMISGDVVDPNWMEGNNRFWYRNKTGAGYEFILVDPVGGTRAPLFDHVRLAASMSLAADTAFIAEKLPFESLEFLRDETAIEFNAHKKRFECDIRTYDCTVGDTVPDDTPFVESPDERWEAFVHEHNVYVRPAGGRDSIQLTTDGVEYWSYGLTAPRPNDIKDKRVRRPSIVWSPDSRKMVVARTDERNVEHMHYISMTPQRPVHYSQPYALPGDSVIPSPGFHVLTLEPAGNSIRLLSNHAVEVEPHPHRMYLNGTPSDSTWSAGSDRCYVSYATRGSKSIHLAEIAAGTGESHLIVSDSSKTFIDELRPDMYGASWHATADGNDVIWWSEDDGWAHLYRLDRNGNVKNQITAGPWFVSTLYHVDEARQQIYFTGRGRESGRNIYFAHVYRVNFDGSGLTLITPEDADHTIRWSPSGRFFVDTYSRVETAPVTVVRAIPDGRVVVRAEEADISRLAEIGWEPAEVFTVKARDGVTDLYGLIYFPPNIDSTQQYPIISHIYPGPQIGSVRGYNFKGGGEDFSLAQLGFVVIQLDHLGTPFRSKAFHDNYYGNFTDNGIPDHVTAIKQLAARYPFIDLDRVGIYGHSGGGFASTDAILRFPEFFKVAVSGAGNHDNRSYNIYWAEKYQGLMERDTVKNSDNFEASANKTYAKNLQGKLLLMHGDMDDNVHPAMTIQVVDELIKANRDFDLIIAPGRAHGLDEPYFIRRRWDYFVRHLLGAEPPKNYEIKRPEN